MFFGQRHLWRHGSDGLVRPEVGIKVWWKGRGRMTEGTMTEGGVSKGERTRPMIEIESCGTLNKVFSPQSRCIL